MRKIDRLCLWAATTCTSLGVVTLAFPQGREMSPRMTGIRPEAMGGAFTAVADDHNALYYNPAGLAQQSFSMELLNVKVGFNKDLYSNAQTIKTQVESMSSSNDSSASKSGDQVRTITKLIDSVKGKNNWLQFGLNPNLVVAGVGFAVNFNNELNLTLKDPSPDLLKLIYENDVDVRLGYGRGFLNNRLSAGAALAFRHRAEINGTLGLQYLDAALGGQDKLQKKLTDLIHIGQGIGLDSGLLFKAEEKFNTTFGLCIQNIGDLHFKKSTFVTQIVTDVPQPLEQSINFGMSVKPQWGKMYVLGSAEFKDMNIPGPASRKLGLGAEAGFSNLIRAQMGLSEGYFTGGFEARLWIINARYATYVSERGASAGQMPERRHVIGAKILL